MLRLFIVIIFIFLTNILLSQNVIVQEKLLTKTPKYLYKEFLYKLEVQARKQTVVDSLKLVQIKQP